MQLVDTNIIWFALSVPGHLHHAAGHDWLKEVGSASAQFCRSTQQSFLRLLTNGTAMGAYGLKAHGNRAAWQAYEKIRIDDRVGWVDEPSGIDPIWKKLSSDARPATKLWMDAYLAAFAIVGGYRFVTADLGFKQFKDLDLQLIQVVH
jgi:toxin-antitoxin system PIN domain toxin